MGVITLIIIALCSIFDFVFPFKPQISYSKTIYDRHGAVLQAFLNDTDKWRLKLELHEVNPLMQKAFLAKEDRWFYWHFGVNPLAIGRALFQNISQGRRASGASTITMQVVRLLQPKNRTYGNKLIEIVRAIQLELHFSKKEILTMYFNLVPYGSNIEGLKSASLVYFQKNADRLSLAEIAALCIIPNRPSSLRLGHNNIKIVNERNKMLDRFVKNGDFTKIEVERAKSEELNCTRNILPKIAPHFCRRMSTTKKEDNITSSLDLNYQRITEQLAKNYMQRMSALQLYNTAILVVDNKTRTVLSYIGSQDFNDNHHAGQVDGVLAVRSPGSTLKPLLYGLAFDHGIATPQSSILDVPTNIDGYEPENFDMDFHGKVTYSYALANSLNIPAVNILHQMGSPVMIEALKKSNFRTIKKKEKELGLSLILGGCGVNLEELTNLFTTFAHEGEYAPISFEKNKQKFSTTRILSKESNYLITNILSQITRPDLPNNYSYTYRLPKLAWKTGTSFGKKDAWSIGYNKDITVGVWVGNFDGTGVPELSGANIATPLMFDVFAALQYGKAGRWFLEPKGLKSRKICIHSGDLPSAQCKNLAIDYFLPGITHTHTCSHLKKVFVSESEKISYCTACLPATGATEIWIENIPPQLLAYYQLKKISYASPYPHNPICTRIFEDKSLKISFPIHKSTYYLERADQQKLSISCLYPADTKKIYWYANNRFLGQRAPGDSLLLVPQAGKNILFCLDDKSRSHQIEFWVKYNE